MIGCARLYLQCVSLNSPSFVSLSWNIKATDVKCQGWKCYNGSLYFRIYIETGQIQRNTLHLRKCLLCFHLSPSACCFQMWRHFCLVLNKENFGQVENCNSHPYHIIPSVQQNTIRVWVLTFGYEYIKVSMSFHSRHRYILKAYLIAFAICFFHIFSSPSVVIVEEPFSCLLYTSPSPRD